MNFLVVLIVVVVATAAEGFKCHAGGTFPDPDSCQKYHMCHESATDLIHQEIPCTSGPNGEELLYDITRGLCLLGSGVTCHVGGKKRDEESEQLIGHLMELLEKNHIPLQ